MVCIMIVSPRFFFSIEVTRAFAFEVSFMLLDLYQNQSHFRLPGFVWVTSLTQWANWLGTHFARSIFFKTDTWAEIFKFSKFLRIYTGHRAFQRHAAPGPPRATANEVDWTLVRSPMEDFLWKSWLDCLAKFCFFFCLFACLTGFYWKLMVGIPRTWGLLSDPGTPGNPLCYNTHRSAPPVSALAHSRGSGARQADWL